jgi:quercetin dioxygenase-like cupin family protein
MQGLTRAGIREYGPAGKRMAWQGRVGASALSDKEERHMSPVLTQLLKKRLDEPDEVRTFSKGRAEVVRLGEQVIMRVTLEPGWRWSKDLKPEAGTESCEARHLAVLLSGRLATRMNDGAAYEFSAGDVADIPPGHDGWVIGSEPAVFLDFAAGEHYGKAAGQ